MTTDLARATARELAEYLGLPLPDERAGATAATAGTVVVGATLADGATIERRVDAAELAGAMAKLWKSPRHYWSPADHAGLRATAAALGLTTLATALSELAPPGRPARGLFVASADRDALAGVASGGGEPVSDDASRTVAEELAEYLGLRVADPQVDPRKRFLVPHPHPPDWQPPGSTWRATPPSPPLDRPGRHGEPPAPGGPSKLVEVFKQGEREGQPAAAEIAEWFASDAPRAEFLTPLENRPHPLPAGPARRHTDLPAPNGGPAKLVETYRLVDGKEPTAAAVAAEVAEWFSDNLARRGRVWKSE